MYYYNKKGFDSELRGYLLDYLYLKILYVSAADLNGTMFIIHIEIAALLFRFWAMAVPTIQKKVGNHQSCEWSTGHRKRSSGNTIILYMEYSGH
jgi:hypothetical protein